MKKEQEKCLQDSMIKTKRINKVARRNKKQIYDCRNMKQIIFFIKINCVINVCDLRQHPFEVLLI